MKVATRKKAAKPVWRQYRIQLEGKRRPDGSLFVTSPNLGPFSAVIKDGQWNDVIPYVQKFLEANFGRVKELRLIEDASELMPDSSTLSDMPPAYVIAELTSQRARAA